MKQLAASDVSSGEVAEALYLEERSGLSFAVPGHPTLKTPSKEGFAAGAAVGLSGEITLADAPITLRIYCSSCNLEPQALAAQARAHVERRARGHFAVHVADVEPRKRLGVDAAASANYRLARTVGADVETRDAESVLFLLRNELLIVIEIQFFVEKTPLATWIALGSAVNDSLHFANDPAPIFSGIAWPPSEFLRPGLAGLTPAAQLLIPGLKGALRLTRATTRKELARRAARLLHGSEPKETPFSVEDRLLLDQLLGDVCETRAQEDLLTSLTARIKTTHDVRGFAITLLQALDALGYDDSAKEDLEAATSIDTFLLYEE